MKNPVTNYDSKLVSNGSNKTLFKCLGVTLFSQFEEKSKWVQFNHGNTYKEHTHAHTHAHTHTHTRTHTHAHTHKRERKEEEWVQQINQTICTQFFPEKKLINQTLSQLPLSLTHKHALFPFYLKPHPQTHTWFFTNFQ